MSRVFVVQEPAVVPRRTGGQRYEIDLTPAKQFGDLVFLLEWSETRDMNPETMKHLLTRRCASYTTEDWLLMKGNPVAMGLALVACACVTGGLVKGLYWEREARRYTEWHVDVGAELDRMREAAPGRIPAHVDNRSAGLRREVKLAPRKRAP